MTNITKSNLTEFGLGRYQTKVSSNPLLVRLTSLSNLDFDIRASSIYDLASLTLLLRLSKAELFNFLSSEEKERTIDDLRETLKDLDNDIQSLCDLPTLTRLSEYRRVLAVDLSLYTAISKV